MQLAIDRTWDDQPAPHTEVAKLELQLSPSELRLRVDAPYHGDPAPAVGPGSCPRLWDYEVVECFLIGPDGRYLEVEVGPHGHYLILELSGVRNIVGQATAASYEWQVDGDRWSGTLVLARELLPQPLLRMNAFAVHGSGAARRYLCWSALPAATPDFHQPQRFPIVSEADLA